MNFKKGDRVIYPVNGAGKIVEIYPVEIGGEKIKYYKIEFNDTAMSTSVPVDKAEDLGMRSPLTTSKIRKLLENLTKKVKPKEEEIDDLQNISRDALLTGDMDEAIELYGLIKGIERKRGKDDKKLNATEERSLKMTMNFIKSEVSAVLGEKAVIKYGLNDEVGV